MLLAPHRVDIRNWYRLLYRREAPYAQTGYGKMTREIVSRLIERGMQVYSIGGIGGMTVWGGKMEYPTPRAKITVLPTIGDIGGSNVAEMYIHKYKLDLMVTLWDTFITEYTGNLSVPAVNYMPIDGHLTGRMAHYVRNAIRVVAYSKFGHRELLSRLPASQVGYIPHGVDCSVYKPFSDEARQKVRSMILPKGHQDGFLFLNVGANMGERKQLPLLLIAFKRFLERNPKADAYLFLFTNADQPYPQGYDLPAFADELGIRQRLLWPSESPILEPVSEHEMASLMSAANVYVSPALGEGFGLPVIESESCGTPVIHSNSSTAPELVGGHGWLVEIDPEYLLVPAWIPTLQTYPVVKISSLVNCMEEAYNSPDLVKKYGEAARRFAQGYDWPLVMPGWFKLFQDVEEEIEVFREVLKSRVQLRAPTPGTPGTPGTGTTTR